MNDAKEPSSGGALPDAAKLPYKDRDPGPSRALKIRTEYPGAIYDAIEAQMGKLNSVGYPVGFIGEPVGFVQAENPAHPLRAIRTRIHGNLAHTRYVDIPDEPGKRQGVGERRKEFSVDTRFGLPNHTYVNETQTTQLMVTLRKFGYDSQLEVGTNGNRQLTISTPEGQFGFTIGWPSPDSKVQDYKQNIERLKKDDPGMVPNEEGRLEKVFRGHDACDLYLQTTIPNPDRAPVGLPLESREQVIAYLNRVKDLTEVAATALVQAITPGKRFPELRMDWLPPELVKNMETRDSTEVVGRVEATAAIETIVDEGMGLERLTGLPSETLAELRRIAERLRDPRRAAFMKKHGFKQSNGAIFWGVPGTGKTLAGEAVAEESGCERTVLKVDEYMTAYMHESARRIGEKLREIKSKASEEAKTVIVQIDEADTILAPINGRDSVSSRDASEVRAVLLREFQEPSNVFYILTTNLDPRDPQQADPAIVRNQRLGYLVGFSLPETEGRQGIFEKEIGKRSDQDMAWGEINFASLAETTNGFSPADIQEVLSVAVGEGYNPDTEAAYVTQDHLEKAINLIKARKLTEEKIRKAPLGFVRDR